MKNEKTIYQTKPKFNIYGLLFIFLIGVYFVYTSETLIMKLFMGGIFTITLIIAKLKIYLANGIIITESGIEISKQKITGNIENIKINFAEIERIKYNKGAIRRDRAIYIKTSQNSDIKFIIPENSFEFAPILKFLKNQGIEIILVHSDQELRMFINGEITDFPVKTEKTA